MYGLISKLTMRIASILVLLAFGPTGTGAAQIGTLLDSRIPAPIRAKYGAVRDARDWLNPQVTIRPEGVEVLSRALPGGRKTVSTGDLRSLLVALPVDAWPYGRVVLASDAEVRRENASRSLHESDEEAIRRNHEATMGTLRILNIEAVSPPP